MKPARSDEGAGTQDRAGSFERHYTPVELAELWQVSEDFIRRLFLKEPGVVVFHRARPGRRVYRTLRIPASVAERVHHRLSLP